MPAVALRGVHDRDEGSVSPNLTKDSIVFSRLPPCPLRIVVLRFSSIKPIWHRVASLPSKSSPGVLSEPTAAPKALDALFLIGGEGLRRCSLSDSI